MQLRVQLPDLFSLLLILLSFATPSQGLGHCIKNSPESNSSNLNIRVLSKARPGLIEDLLSKHENEIFIELKIGPDRPKDLTKLSIEEYNKYMENKESHLRKLKKNFLSSYNNSEITILNDYPSFPKIFLRVKNTPALIKILKDRRVDRIYENDNPITD